jgi:crotonobetainyl-CoA:carnitine CoA-transferase CaiB-like acyl-CoA transferase
VLRPGEIYGHPQAGVNGMVVAVEHPTLGTLRLVGSPVQLSETPASVRTAPPGIGEHSEEIRAELGVDDGGPRAGSAGAAR